METAEYAMTGEGALVISGGGVEDETELTTDESSKSTIETYPCVPGSQIQYTLDSKDDLSLDFFEDFNPCPLGLFIVAS